MSNLAAILERFLRRRIVYPLLRLLFHNRPLDHPLDVTHITRVLIFRYDRIGDMIVTTPIFRLLKSLNPQVKIDVLASRTNAEIIHGSPWVDRVYIMESNWFRLLALMAKLRKQRYQVLLNFIFNRTTGPAILANLIVPNGSKIGQGPDRFGFYFNRLIRVKRFEQHMLESYVSIVEQTFGITADRANLAYDISVSNASRAIVSAWLEQHSIRPKWETKSACTPYLVLNPSGKDDERSLSVEQVAGLTKALSGNMQLAVVILDSPGNEKMRRAFQTMGEFRHCLVYRTSSAEPLSELASLIKGAAFVISPDTSIIHFASAVGTPVLAVYAPANASEEWLPYRVEYDIVMAKENERVADIDSSLLIKGVRHFIGRMDAAPKTSQGSRHEA